METPALLISQELADEWALIAQRYAGYFYGHPVRAGQHGQKAPEVYVETDKPWTAPMAFEDDCDFCKITKDDRVRARVAGFQKAIQIEVDRANTEIHSLWGIITKPTTPTWAIDLTELPFYLQRRLCIEWNHALKRWLEGQEALEYDFEEHALMIKEAGNTLLPTFAADPEERAVLQADLEADYAFAATLPTQDDLTLPEQIAQEYENGL